MAVVKIEFQSNGVFFLCPHCSKNSTGLIEIGVNVFFIYCSLCNNLVINMDKKIIENKMHVCWNCINWSSISGKGFHGWCEVENIQTYMFYGRDCEYYEKSKTGRYTGNEALFRERS